MKSFLILGMSTFGQHLCKRLNFNKCQVMIADNDSSVIEPMLQFCESAKICDCTNPDVLDSFGVDEFDACFVCMGGYFREALEVTDMLRERRAKRIITEVNRDVEKKFMLRNGADAVVYPEQDVAERIAASESNDSIFDAIELSSGYAIYEITTPEAWLNKTVKSLEVRVKYKLSIIAAKNGDDIKPVINADYVFNSADHLMVLGHVDDIKKVVK